MLRHRWSEATAGVWTYRVPDLKLDLLLVDSDHTRPELNPDRQICFSKHSEPLLSLWRQPVRGKRVVPTVDWLETAVCKLKKEA